MNDQHGYKKRTVEDLTELFLRGSKVGFPLIVVAVIVGFIAPFFSESLTEKMLVSKLTFVNMGLLFSIFQLFLGVLLALIGVSVDYDLDASVGPAKVKLISASPGILLIVCANLLFAFSVMRSFEVTEAQSSTAKSEVESLGNSSDRESKPAPLGVKGP